MKEKIKEIILSHIGSINSFIDKDGRNHFDRCVQDLADLKMRRAGQYKHMDGSLCCKKCNLTIDEGCKHN